MAGMITRCPKCATAFRISETHLQSAKGMVRCGSCLEVFNARDNIQQKASAAPSQHAVKPAPAKPTANQAPPTATPSPPPAVAPARAAAASEPAKARSSEPARSRASATPEPAATPIKKSAAGVFDSAADDAPFDQEDDEAWALELLKDDSDLNIQLKKIVTPEDALARAAKNSPAPKPIKPKPARAAPAASKATATQAAPTFKPPKPLHDVLAAIEPDPLEVAYEDDGSRRRRRLIWSGASFLAALVLAGQIAWLEFHRLNTIEPYRSWYARVCPYLNCTVPEQVDRRAIDTSQLMVRSHPSVAGALVVDVILQNNAPFEQPFPNILLTFSNLQNETVAARRFTPTEYLGGELAGSTHMPTRQPIHVGFEIQDPGSEALNYQLTIVD